MSSFLFGCKFMLVNLLIYSLYIKNKIKAKHKRFSIYIILNRCLSG